MRRGVGFSMTELLVVIAILGLIAGTVGPRLMQFSVSHKRRLELNRVEDFLARAPNIAYVRGSSLQLRGGAGYMELQPDGPRLMLDDGWVIKVEEPVSYGANGATSGGLIDVVIGTRVFRYRQSSGEGRVSLDEGT